MAKGSGRNPPNKHLHSRVSFLYQAATYLSGAHAARAKDAGNSAPRPSLRNPCLGSSRRMLSHLRGVSRKAQIRLSKSMKHAICKRCESLLVAGSSSTQYVENSSRGGKKPWADVIVIECNHCGTKTRFPVGATRQPRKSARADGRADGKADAVSAP